MGSSNSQRSIPRASAQLRKMSTQRSCASRRAGPSTKGKRAMLCSLTASSRLPAASASRDQTAVQLAGPSPRSDSISSSARCSTASSRSCARLCSTMNLRSSFSIPASSCIVRELLLAAVDDRVGNAALQQREIVHQHVIKPPQTERPERARAQQALLKCLQLKNEIDLRLSHGLEACDEVEAGMPPFGKNRLQHGRQHIGVFDGQVDALTKQRRHR